MAKKGTIDFDDMNVGFDNDDFDDFNFDMKPRQPKNAREAIAQAAPSVLEGFKDSAMDTNNIRRMAEKALPKSFSYALSEVDKYADGYGQLSREIDKEIRPTVTAMTKVAQRVNRIIPSPVQGKLEAFFDRRLQTADKRQDIDAEEAAVMAMLQDGMGGDGGEGALTKNRRAEEAIEKIDERNYRVKMFQTISEVRDATVRQSTYTFTQQRQYNRKVLEVQIRQLLTQRKHLELATRTSVEVSSLLRDVVKNTGLPEFAKEHANESFRRTAREMMFGRVQRPIANWTQNYVKGITKNYTNLFKQRMASLKRGSEMATDQFDMIKDAMAQAEQFGESKLSVLGGLSGDALFEYIGGMGAEKLRKAFPDAGKVDNLFSYLLRGMRNLPYKASKYGAGASGVSFKDELRRGLYVGYDKDENQVVRGGGLSGLGGMDYERRNSQALYEILPGYLSRILHSIDMMRTGDPNTPRIVFSKEKGSFTTMKESSRRLEHAILSKGKVANQADEVQSLMTSMGVGESDHALRAKLGRHLMNMSSTATGFDPEGFVNGKVDGLTAREQTRLSKILKAKYGLKHNAEKDRWEAGLSANNRKISDSQELYARVQRANSGIYNNVQAAVNTGSLEELIALGIVHYSEDEKAWVIKDGYMSGRRREGMGDSIVNARNAKRQARGRPTDVLPPKPSDKAPGGFGFGGSSITENISGKGAKSIVRSIETQTEELLDSLHELIGVSSDNFDVLNDIYEQIGAGVTVNGYGFKPGLLGRTASRAFKGARWAGRKMWNITGAPFRGANWLRKKLTSGIGGAVSGWYKGKEVRGRVNRFMTDVYVFGQGGLRKALDAAGFSEGRYINMSDGSVIKSLRDIKSGVYDLDAQKQVISQEEYEAGLLNSIGKRIMAGPLGSLGAGVKKVFDIATSPVTGLWKAGKGLIKNTLSTFMSPPDIYVPGEPSPRILGDLMYKGTYFSGMTGKPLKYLGDIDGEIVTYDRISGTRKVVVTLEEVQAGLVDNKGKPLTPFFRKIRNLITAGKNFALGVLKAPGTVLKWAKNKLKSMGSGLGNALNKMFQGRDNKLSQVFWLERIYKLLYTKFTGGKVKGNKDLQGAMDSIASGAERAANKASAKARELYDKVKPDDGESWWSMLRRRGAKAKGQFDETSAGKTMKEKLGLVTGSAAMARAQDAKDDLMARSGSWLEQMRERAKAKKEEIKAKVGDNKEKGKSLFSGLGGMLVTALGGVMTGFLKKFSWMKSALTKLIPDTLMKVGRMIVASKAGDSITDALEDGPGKRKGKRWWRRLKATKGAKWLGRMARPVMNLGGRAAAVLGADAVLGGGAAAAASSAAASTASAAAGAATAGMGLLSTIGTGLVAVGGFLMSPWVLGGMAVAGAIYGGYKLYQYYAKKAEFSAAERVRLVQYGMQLDSQHDTCAKILALEDDIAPAISWQGERVSFDVKKINMKGIAEMFGIPMDTGQQFAQFSGWFTKRFIPIYSSWLMSARRCANLTNIQKLDIRVSPAILLQIVRGSFNADTSEGSPYMVDQSPIPGYYIAPGVSRIQAAMATIERELSTSAKDATKDSRVYQPLGRKDGFTAPSSNLLNRKSILPAATPNVDGRVDDYYGAAERLTTGRITGNAVSDDLIAKFNQIDDMTALRMKVYGLERLHKVYVDILQRFERDLYKQVSWGPDGRAIIDFSKPYDIYVHYAPLFSLDPTDKEAAQVFVYWLTKRFLPAYTTYLAACHKVDPNGDPFTAYGRFRGTELLAVAQATSRAAAPSDDGRQFSVWLVDAIPFPNERANLKASSAAINLQAFEQAVKSDVYADSKVNARTKLTTQGVTTLQNRLQNLTNDMAAVTGNTRAYSYTPNNTNSYSASNNISTSWTSAGYEGQEVSNVKLAGDSKSRGEMLMKMALSAGLSGDELALFMGTCAQETGDFNSYVEKGANVAAYAANKSLGNGSASNAAKYIGRGPIQMTGLNNYQNATRWLQADGVQVDFVANPEKMADPYYGSLAALAYWKNYLRPLIAKKGRQLDPLTVSAATNGWYEDPNAQGGLRTPNGYDVRLRKILQWRKIINGDAPDPTAGDTQAAADTTKAVQGPIQAAGPNTPPGTEAGAGTGGQQTAPSPGGAPATNPTSPAPSASLKPGQAMAPSLPAAAPQDAYRTNAMPSTPSSMLVRPNGGAAATQQQRQAEAAQTAANVQAQDMLPALAQKQVNVLEQIRDILLGKGGKVQLDEALKPADAPAPNPAAANTTPTPPVAKPNTTSNVSPKATPESVAPATAQKTPTEDALANRPAPAPQQSQEGAKLPFDVSL